MTGSLKHVYDFHGYPISEELLLGLGSGLGFVYFHFKGTDPFYGGRANHASPRAEGLEKTAGRRTGVAVASHATSSARVAQAELRQLLEAGEPTLVYVDMGFLPYFDLPAGYHFGGHVVVVAGYDPQTGQVLIADRDQQLHSVDWDVLEQARGSAFRPFPPRHSWYTFDFSNAREPRPSDVRAAITEVCDGMLTPPIGNLGVRGIRKAIQETLRWPDALGTDALRRTCFNTALFIDARGGTGGGIFRYMYARFLGEAASITGEARLDELGSELNAIGDLWEDVAATFSAAAELDNPADLLGPATRPMYEIADREELLWQSLKTLTADEA
ncbi:BtrH N-terminal domain-containing protein [Kribbella sp. VKM Ac-2571]|uniref:BtrH N-terminal domain-containing protein n=1 Tax=Kribbella sp. VKM Ac-2571 TaxID=2512222 RepID=UPI001414F167|nr:BtrH N-terminal domain-containing protein [Kribbella sp. VKM Ac-2571]